MSKKTTSIYKCLDTLDKLQNDLSNIITTSTMEETRELSDIEFNVKQELRELRFWIDSLYKYNGKSTSIMKKSASKENGKKGGRPPKEITLARKKITELETEVIPSLEKEMMLSNSNEKISEKEEMLEKAKRELEECQTKVYEYKRSKELSDSLSRL